MVKEEMKMTREMIESKIKEVAGEELWKSTQFAVRITEKRTRYSSWKSTPMGMFVISVGYGAGRTAVHTKKDGSFDVARVVELIQYEEDCRGYQAKARIARENNLKIAQNVAEAAQQKGISEYVTNYGKVESVPTVVPTSGSNGVVDVGLGFRGLNEAQATRALELYAQMKKELAELA